MASSAHMILVCQRCCNPITLHSDFEHLQEDNVLALVDAQRPENDDNQPPIIIPVKNMGDDYPTYLVPPNPTDQISDPDILYLPQSFSSPASSLDHRQKVSAFLFDILSGRTDVDHPLCQECADVLITAQQQLLEYQEEELQCVRQYLHYLDAKAARFEAKLKSDAQNNSDQASEQPAGDQVDVPYISHQPHKTGDAETSDWLSCLSSLEQPSDKTVLTFDFEGSWAGEESDEDNFSSSDSDSAHNRSGSDHPDSATSQRASCSRKLNLTELQTKVEELQAKLANVLAEGDKLDERLARDNAELDRCTGELDEAQTQYNEQKQISLEAEEELFCLEARVKHAEQHLQRLLRTNVLNTVFPIWYDEHFCIINRLHLGRLSNRPVSWEEINSAWGQCAMLLQCIAKKLNFTFTDYRVSPMGSQSRMIDLTNHKEYPLYYATTGMQLFAVSKFDNAMCMFLKCLSQLQSTIEDSTQTKLPFCIKDDGKLHDPREVKTCSIKWSGNSEENWTKALKMMLLNMKWMIAAIASIDGQGMQPSSTLPTPDTSNTKTLVSSAETG